MRAQTDAELAEQFQVDEVIGDPLPPSWNVAPTDSALIVVERTSRQRPDQPAQRQLRPARWGLVPSWAKDVSGSARLINARVETITEKSSFKTAARKRRCVVPADGYYEWEKTTPTVKTPYYLHPDTADALAFAGLYELWRDPSKTDDTPDRWLWSYTIVTTTASDTLGHIHDRAPLILPADLVGDWLDPSLSDPTALIASIPELPLIPTQVSQAVSNVRNNGPELINPVAP